MDTTITTMSKQCHKCSYSWKTRTPEPKACPECKARLKGNHAKPILRNTAVPKPSEQMDFERDVFKLTRTPKHQFADACALIRQNYSEEVAELIINKAMDGKREWMQKNKSNQGSDLVV